MKPLVKPFAAVRSPTVSLRLNVSPGLSRVPLTSVGGPAEVLVAVLRVGEVRGERRHLLVDAEPLGRVGGDLGLGGDALDGQGPLGAGLGDQVQERTGHVGRVERQAGLGGHQHRLAVDDLERRVLGLLGDLAHLRGQLREQRLGVELRLELGADRLHRQGRREVGRLQAHSFAAERDHDGAGHRGVGEAVHGPAHRVLRHDRRRLRGGEVDRVGGGQERRPHGLRGGGAVDDRALLRVLRLGLVADEADRPLRRWYVDPVGHPCDGGVERGPVDGDDRLLVVAAGEVLPHPDRVPAAPATGRGNGRGHVDAETGPGRHGWWPARRWRRRGSARPRARRGPPGAWRARRPGPSRRWRCRRRSCRAGCGRW